MAYHSHLLEERSSSTRFRLFCGLPVLLCLAANAFALVEHKDPNDQADLFDMSIEELLEIEISVASKVPERQIEAPGIVTVVPRSEIEIYGDRNLFQLLQRQPSIYTRGSYMYPYNIASFRGNMPTHLDLNTLILLNGRPIRESAFGGVNFPVYLTLPMAGVESVEIIRGPGSVLYGTNAFTGVVNIKPRVGSKQNEYSINYQGGSYGYYESDISASGRTGELGYSTAIRVSGQEGYPYGLTDGLGVYNKDYDKNRSISGVGHLDYGDFTFNFFATSMETFHIGPLPFWSVPGQVFRVNKFFGNAGYHTELNDRATLELNLTYNLHENDFAGFPTGGVSLNTSDILGETTLFINPIENLNVVLGYLQEYLSNHEGNDFESIPLYHRRPQSAYAQADYKIGNTYKVIAGTQWNKSGQGYSDLISRYGLIITPSEKWGVKLLRGEAFRAPFALETDLYDLPILVGNSDLEPEFITTYDAQLFYTDDRTHAALTYFNSTLDNLIIRDTSVSPTSFKNGGKQHFDGVEFEIKRALTRHWHILGSFMHQENSQTSDINPSVTPDDMLKFGTGYTWDWGSAGLFYSFFSRPPRLGTEVVVNPEPDAMNLLSFNLQVDPSQWLDIPKGRSLLTFKVENLFDEDIYVPEFQRAGNPNSLPYGPGRTFYCGLKVRF